MFLFGWTLVLRLCKRSLVYASTGKDLMSVVPASMSRAYLLVHSSFTKVHNGSWVKMVLAAWEKWIQCC